MSQDVAVTAVELVVQRHVVIEDHKIEQVSPASSSSSQPLRRFSSPSVAFAVKTRQLGQDGSPLRRAS